MNFLEERIVKDGIVKEGNVLKVDSFLNHQMDIELFDQMGAEFKKRFADRPINKILTIEASGIGIACVVAQHFGVPVVFAKKTKSINIEGEMYTAEVESFTHKCKNQVIVAKKFLSEDDHVLIIDDFLANGCSGCGGRCRPKIPDAGRSCSYYRRFSCERMRSSGIDPDRESCRRNCRGNRNRD